MTPRPLPYFAILAILFAGAIEPADAQATVSFLANEGVVIEGATPAGPRKVLVDALMLRYRGYALPDSSMQVALRSGRAPYDADVVLVTHRHGDHFHPLPVAAHLRANPRATLLTSPQVIDSLRSGAFGISRARALGLPVRRGALHRDTVNGVPITLLGIPHGGGDRHAAVEHLGYLIELGGRRILHIGDAELSEAAFASLRLDTMRVDLALVPHWALTDASTRMLLERVIGPARFAAFHLGKRDDDARSAIRSAMPDAIILTRGVPVVLR